MAIYDYTDESYPHPAGAQIIRVVVSAGPEVYQRYFGKGELAKAKAWEAAQLKKRDTYNRKLKRQGLPVATHGLDYTKTGLNGVRINISKNKGRKGQVYYRCIIAMNVMSEVTGRKAVKSSIVTQDTLQSKWKQVCKELSLHKGMSSVPKSWIERCPTPGDFHRVIKNYSKQKRVKNIGFKSLPKTKYPSTRANV